MNGRGCGECDIVLLSPVLSVQGLKVSNSRSTVREFSLKDVYLNTLLYSSCFVRLLFNCCNNTQLFQLNLVKWACLESEQCLQYTQNAQMSCAGAWSRGVPYIIYDNSSTNV